MLRRYHKLKMDRNRSKSKKNSNLRAIESGESSGTERLKRSGGREAKRQRIDAVQPTAFDEDEEEVEGESPLQSQLMLSQPLTESQTSDFDGAPVEEMSRSPLLDDLSPLLGASALDALDGWSLGSNLYFSDTGSGGGFLGSQSSAMDEELGTAPLGVLPLRLDKKGPARKVKNKMVSPTLSQSGSVSAKKLKLMLSKSPSEVESPLVLDSVSQSSSSGMSGDKACDGGDEMEEEVVLESVLGKKPGRNVKSKKKAEKVVKAKKGLRCATDARVVCPEIGIMGAESSQASSGTDLFAESENLLLNSVSQSSLEVEYDTTSPPRVVTPPRSGRQLRRRKEVEALLFLERNKDSSAGETSQNSAANQVSQRKYTVKKDVKSAGKSSLNVDKSKQSSGDPFVFQEKNKDHSAAESSRNSATNLVSQRKYTVKKDVKSAGKSSQNVDKSEQSSRETFVFQEENKDRLAGESSQNSAANQVSQKKYLVKTDVKPAGKSSQNVDKSKQSSRETFVFQEENKDLLAGESSQNSAANQVSQKKYLVKTDVKPAGKSSQNVDKSKQSGGKKNRTKFGDIKKSQIVDRPEQNAHSSQKTNSVTKVEESVATTSGYVTRLKSESKSDSQSSSSVGKASASVEHLKSNEQSPVAAVSQDLPTHNRLSLKRTGGVLANKQKDILGDEKFIVGSLPSAVVEDTGYNDDSNLEDEKKESSSAPKKLPEVKNKRQIKDGRGKVVAVAARTSPVELEKPTIKTNRKKTAEKTVPDDGRAKEADDGVSSDDAETADDSGKKSPGLFEYESDSLLAPPKLIPHARKPKTDKKCLDQSEQRKNLSMSAKTSPVAQLKDSNISQIKAPRDGSHLSTSSRSVLTDSGIVASTPASFTLASRPGLAKLKTSTPLDQYRAIVGLDKPSKGGGKKGKRPIPMDSGNGSDFTLESMLSPVRPVRSARSKDSGLGQFRVDEISDDPNRVQEGKVSEDATNAFPETRPGVAATSKSGAKREKRTVGKEVLSSNVVALERAMWKDDAGESASTATEPIGMVSVKTESQQKKKPRNNRDAASNEANARRHYVEERLLEELDDIDQNYSLIIDD